MEANPSSARFAVVFGLCVATAIILPAQTLLTVHDFDGEGVNGANPTGLVQGANGDLYGITTAGGPGGYGTIFQLTSNGAFKTLYSFSCTGSGCPNGVAPTGLIQASDGNLYGTTYGSGTQSYGTVFEITPGGVLTTLYSFCSQSGCSDGEYPAAVVQATNGDFYGTTYSGGAYGYGTVFQITPGGTLTTLYSFCSQNGCADGEYSEAGLVQARNGDFYGTSAGGGANGHGTVFQITPSGTLTTLYSFCPHTGCTDGEYPETALIQAADGDFYGISEFGGPYGYGSVFRVTPSGTLTTLYGFCGRSSCPAGSNPIAALVQAANGDFFGSTLGGFSNGGTLFKITASGTLTTLFAFPCGLQSFEICPDGDRPAAAMIQGTDGSFYGTTVFGGLGEPIGYGPGYGTIFRLSDRR